jgi:hypothetical protein
VPLAQFFRGAVQAYAEHDQSFQTALPKDAFGAYLNWDANFSKVLLSQQ